MREIEVFNKKIVMIFLVAVLLSSCATTPKLSSVDLTDEEILVIAGYEDKFHIKVIGTTAFTNHYAEYEGFEFDANSVIAETFNRIENSPEFKIYEGDLQFDFTSGNSFTGHGFNLKAEMPKLKQIAATCGCRYALLVGSDINLDNMFDTNQYFSNYGVVQRSFLGDKTNKLFASIKIGMLDLTTMKIIDKRSIVGSKAITKLRRNKMHEMQHPEFDFTQKLLPGVFDKTINKLLVFIGLVGE